MLSLCTCVFLFHVKTFNKTLTVKEKYSVFNNETNNIYYNEDQVEINYFSSSIFWIEFFFVALFSFFLDVPNKIRPLNLYNWATGTNSFQEKQPINSMLNAPVFVIVVLRRVC